MAIALLALTIPDDDTVPASRIMREREDYKERWAREMTRAESLDRELASALRRAKDWEAIALENGERAAQLNVTLARIQKVDDEARADRGAMTADRDYWKQSRDYWCTSSSSWRDRSDKLAKELGEARSLASRFEQQVLELKRENARLRGEMATYRDALGSIANTVYEYHRPASDSLDSIEGELHELIDDDALFEDCGPSGCFHLPSDTCGGLKRVPR